MNEHIDPEVELAYAPYTPSDSPGLAAAIREALDAEYAALRQAGGAS